MNDTPNLATPAAAKPKNVLQLLQEPAMVARMTAVLPSHMKPERMLRVMALAVNNTPGLANCTQLSLLGALMICGTLGLEPNTPLGEIYLIPFNKRKKEADGKWTSNAEVQVIIGYRGFISLARRSGEMASIQAEVVYEGDEFSFEYGTNQHLRHKPIGSRTGKKPTHAYCYVQLKDGHMFAVLPYDEVLKTRNSSQGYVQALANKDAAEDWKKRAYEMNPWVKHEHEMAKKTAIRYLAKMLPMTIEFANAVHVDEAADRTTDYSAFRNITTNLEGNAQLGTMQIEHNEDGVINTEVKVQPESKTQPETVADKTKPAAEGAGAGGGQQAPSTPAATTEKKPGRPPGAKNKPKEEMPDIPKDLERKKDPVKPAETKPPQQEEPPPAEDDQGGGEDPDEEFKFA